MPSPLIEELPDSKGHFGKNGKGKGKYGEGKGKGEKSGGKYGGQYKGSVKSRDSEKGKRKEMMRGNSEQVVTLVVKFRNFIKRIRKVFQICLYRFYS